MESKSFRAVPYWEVLLQGTRVRERTSETKKEGKPNQGSVTKLEPLWKNRLLNPKEAYSEQYEIHFRRNVFSLAPIPVGQWFAPQGITLLHFWVRFPWCRLLCHEKRSPHMGGKRHKFRKWSPAGDCEKSQSDFYSSVLRPMYYSCWEDSIIFQLLVQHVHHIIEVSIPILYCVCLELVP